MNCRIVFALACPVPVGASVICRLVARCQAIMTEFACPDMLHLLIKGERFEFGADVEWVLVRSTHGAFVFECWSRWKRSCRMRSCLVARWSVRFLLFLHLRLGFWSEGDGDRHLSSCSCYLCSGSNELDKLLHWRNLGISFSLG